MLSLLHLPLALRATETRYSTVIPPLRAPLFSLWFRTMYRLCGTGINTCNQKWAYLQRAGNAHTNPPLAIVQFELSKEGTQAVGRRIGERMQTLFVLTVLLQLLLLSERSVSFLAGPQADTACPGESETRPLSSSIPRMHVN